jgi:hypothetical protein
VKYMLLIYGNEDLWTSFDPDAMAEIVKDTDELNRQLFASGELVGGYGVDDQANAKCVQIVDGTPVVTDGPYIETKEYLGSFSILDVDSLDRALEIAALNPASRFTRVEIKALPHEGSPEG